MDLGLKGRSALVLGGTAGLGLSCARVLCDEGARVIINGRDAGRAAEAAARIGATSVTGDVSSQAERARIVKAAREAVGDIDILVTNAGGPPPGPADSHDHETWLRALETNMLAALDFARQVLPGMIARGYGRIVNVTSFTVREPYPNMGLATGARAGLHGAMAALAREVAPTGVTINNLLPGLMDTGALRRVYAAQSRAQGITEEEAKARMAHSVPMQRLGTAEDFGPACAFLCSVHASYITGQNLTVDGGLVRSML